MRELLHAHFGVTHGRREIAVDRTEVALTVDEHVAHREVLRHAYHGVVDRGVAVRMVFTDHVADDARRFLVRLVDIVAELLHREQPAAVHRPEASADERRVGKGWGERVSFWWTADH